MESPFALGNGYGLRGERRFQDRVPPAAQEDAGKAPHRLLVLHEQDGLPAPGKLRAAVFSVFMGKGSRDAGEREAKLRPRAGLAPHLDMPLVLVHDPIYRGKAEPRARPRLLGREERLEEVGLHLISHTRTGVTNGEHDLLDGGRGEGRIRGGGFAFETTGSRRRASRRGR